MTSIAFIGGGNMATSLIGGLVEGGHPAGEIWVAEPLDTQRQRLSERFGVHVTADNAVAAGCADTVVLAVKPQVMQQVVTALGPTVRARQPLVVSIAAGIQEPTIRGWLGDDARIVRCMPNTPALLGCGATALFANEAVRDDDRGAASAILGAAGITLWVETEDEIDAVTAVSGSGPAYFFLLMELMVKAGCALGLTEDVSTRLTLQTALGAARMALEGDDDPASLRAKVTSPGGTTERALAIFSEGGMEELVVRALTGARDRSRELAKSA